MTLVCWEVGFITFLWLVAQELFSMFLPSTNRADLPLYMAAPFT